MSEIPENFRPFDDPVKAVDEITKLYDQSINTLREAWTDFSKNDLRDNVHAFYPQVSVEITERSRTRNSLDSFGFMTMPSHYSTTITRPEFFRDYLIEQLVAIRKNHDVPIHVGFSTEPIPIHFAFYDDYQPEPLSTEQQSDLRYVFDVPSALNDNLDDRIADGNYDYSNGDMPLALFTAPRVDKGMAKATYYSGTRLDFFQDHIIFTNYDDYVQRFLEMAKGLFSEGSHEAKEALGEEAVNTYLALIEPGNVITLNQNIPDIQEQFQHVSGTAPKRAPQMPGYHLVRKDGDGISLVNIGVGPSNAKNMTDNLAVLRPSSYTMLGHCAGLTDDQRLGDYVLANAYHRRDSILDKHVPIDTPIPPIAEIQEALKQGISKAVGLDPEKDREELKRRYRTGTVTTEDDRNWEEDHRAVLFKRFLQSRSIGLDMESATIAANGFRFRVPYGAILCVSDKPLHGEIKLPGMVNEFYKRSVGEHFWAGIHAIESLRKQDKRKVHSRKLRSPFEPPFR
ncbi:MAG: AMP nucleosidase [Pseudomonadota bacterium]